MAIKIKDQSYKIILSEHWINSAIAPPKILNLYKNKTLK